MHKQSEIFKDESMKSYFETLPTVVREAVFQSGVKIHTLEDLKAFAQKYTAT